MATTELTQGNPYTHGERTRTTYSGDAQNYQGCAWCGQKKRRLYGYTDLGRRGAQYCNRECAKAHE